MMKENCTVIIAKNYNCQSLDPHQCVQTPNLLLHHQCLGSSDTKPSFGTSITE